MSARLLTPRRCATRSAAVSPYDPSDLGSVLIYYDGRRIQRALPQVAGETPVAAPERGKPPPPSVDYLALLRRDHERRRVESTAAIRFRAAPADDAQLTGSAAAGRSPAGST